jgi:hypothetical protein
MAVHAYMNGTVDTTEIDMTPGYQISQLQELVDGVGEDVSPPTPYDSLARDHAQSSDSNADDVNDHLPLQETGSN